MKLRDILFILVLLSVICSLNFVVANDINETSLEQSKDADINLISDDNAPLNSLNSNECLKMDENTELYGDSSSVIYVGHNNKTIGGNGSLENPFTTFKAACDNIEGENNVTIYVSDGVYYLGEGLEKDVNTPLIAKTNNLNIIGINGQVIIKNFFNDNDEGLNKEAFFLDSNLGNISFSNIIFDATDCSVYPYIDGDDGNYFSPYCGDISLSYFINCSFIGFNDCKFTL